jgi:hypothetical protein
MPFKDPEKRKAWQKAWLKSKNYVYQRAWTEANKEKCNAAQRKRIAQLPPEKKAAYAAAKNKKRAGQTLTPEQKAQHKTSNKKYIEANKEKCARRNARTYQKYPQEVKDRHLTSKYFRRLGVDPPDDLFEAKLILLKIKRELKNGKTTKS